tara:strand:- start:2352 stop:3209 length:858 start_codon:yes stop_codon:yes gene_type:complete
MAYKGFGRPPAYYFLWILPRNIFSRICGYIADIHIPSYILKPLIIFFSRFYGVNLSESEKNITEFRTFNEFFTRKLNKEARPIDMVENSLISPVDGYIGEFGTIKKEKLLQAKGLDYRLEDLLEDKNRTLLYNGGKYVTIYLAPQNYHRIHSMVKGEVNEFSYITGDLWTVSQLGINYVNNLFARNERLTTYINTKKGECALVKVGATVVGRIKVNYHSQTSNCRGALSKKINLENPYKLEKGQEVGLFELGSTVICLFPPKQVELYNLKIGQLVYFGESIGKIN